MKPHWAPSRRQLLVATLAMLGANAVVLLAYTLPGVVRERSLTSRAAVLREDVEREKKQLEEARQRSEVLKANARDLDRFSREIVKGRKDSVVSTLQYLERTTAELGLTTGSRTYEEKPVKGLKFVRFGIQMPVTGRYQQLVALIEKIERSDRFLVVEEIQLRGRTDAGVDVSFILSTYFSSEEAGSRAD